MIKQIRALALGLGLLGSAALTGMGPISAHAAAVRPIFLLNPPTLVVNAGNCGVSVAGSNFTPGGVVDVFAYGSDGLFRSYKDTTYTLTWFGVQAGSFTQYVGDGNNSTTIQAVAYDETTKQWSNWSSAAEYCIQ